MCIGIPMRVVETGAGTGTALCEGRGRSERLNLMRVGDQPAGTWVLGFQGAAVRVLTELEAAQTNDALDALESVLAGASAAEGFFADLVGREPQLPEHLRGEPT